MKGNRNNVTNLNDNFECINVCNRSFVLPYTLYTTYIKIINQ